MDILRKIYKIVFNVDLPKRRAVAFHNNKIVSAISVSVSASVVKLRLTRACNSIEDSDSVDDWTAIICNT